MERPELEQVISALPSTCGVYRFVDTNREVLYVGKALNIRNRVRSYFHDRPASQKIRNLVAQIADLEVTVTSTELEALVLECNLIKQHRPKYNTRLKDDKHYPYIRVRLGEEWPRVDITRRFARDDARYFGPYTDSRSVWTTLGLLNKLFRFRRCNIEITGTDTRGCLDYHIKRCLGPCMGKVGIEDYRQSVEQVCLFLEGRAEDIVSQLRQRMQTAADELQFERAAYVRDQIEALQRVVEHQKVISTRMEDEDVIAVARNDGEACAEVFFIRGGKLIGAEHFLLENARDEDDSQVMASFVTQFYDSAAYIPSEVLLQASFDEVAVVEQWLRSKRGDNVTIRTPREGQKQELIEMAAANAATALEQLRAKWMADRQKTSAALQELADHLDLPSVPQRIECFDISNFQGASAVGSMVVFQDGQPNKPAYRRFQIKSINSADDFAMLQEVLRRRFRRAKDGDADWVLPDLVIVDGGKGQLNAARETFSELDVQNVSLAALAKEQEEIFVPNQSESIMLPRRAQSLYLMQRIRDEAHRFAISYHQRLRQRSSFLSPLDEIPGIGSKRKSALLRRFGSLQAIREASLEDLAAVDGMTRSAAASLKASLS